MKVAMHRTILAACAALIVTASAQAQTPWPTKPVKILVPTAPGGTADNTARMLAQHMSKVTGQQFYVENRGGAGNILGIEAVARSPADGYTFLLGAGTIAMNHVVYKKLPYDLMKDLTPVTQMVSVPQHAAGASIAAGEDAGRVHRGGESEARSDHLRLRGRRQQSSPRDGGF